MTSRGSKTEIKAVMYLIDTNVISEVRKHSRANRGVRKFFQRAVNDECRLFVSVVTIGELRRGVGSIRHRGDLRQADLLENWLTGILSEFQDSILPVSTDIAQLWGVLRVPHPEHALDKFIAATALIHDLTVVSRNEKDFLATGALVLNPFK